MPDPTLYQRYTRDQALGLFAGASSARPLCGGQWVVLPECVLGFVAVGPRSSDGLGPSYFSSASCFFWVADQPYEFPYDSPTQNTTFLPSELRLPVPQNDRPIHLFARGTGDFVYVGRLRRSPGWGYAGFGYADFPLSPPLPSRVWAEFGGLRLDGLDATALDADLARLSRPTTVQERLDVLRRLVEYWHGAIGPEDGLPDEELPSALPLPLRWWYRLAGRRRGLVDGWSYLLAPSEIRWLEDGRLMFLSDESGFAGVTLPEGDDPLVWGRADGTAPWVEGGTLSGYLIQSCLSGACGAPYRASAPGVTEEDMARLTGMVPEVPLPSWKWPSSAVFFHFGGGTGLVASRHDQAEAYFRYSVQGGSRTDHSLGLLACALSRGWQHLDWAPPTLAPGWLSANGGAAAHLIDVIRAEGRIGDFPFLADALEDAGCDDTDILDHFRRAPHAGPCRIVEALFPPAPGDLIPF